MLSIKNLTKTYPSGVQALKGVSLVVEPGMFGLLGPNGAGKTTLMKIVVTLLEPDSGTVQLDSLDVVTVKDEARKILGYLPQDFGLYPTLTAEQTLDYFARLKGIQDKKQRRWLIEALLEKVNLSSAAKQRVGEFSGGMRQRIGIAQALIGQPKLLIVDEPTAGLDPEERHRFHNLLSETATDDTVVILSTHIVSDVSNICSEMAIIRNGSIVAAGTPREAVEKLKGTVWEGSVPREQVPEVKSRCDVVSSQMFEGVVRLKVISKNGQPVEGFAAATPSLEDYYLDLMRQTQ